MIYLKQLLTFILFLFLVFELVAQDAIQEVGSSVQRAHEKQLKLEDFRYTDKNNFKVKVFAVEHPVVNKSHHWFIQVLTFDNLYVNYGSVEVLSGYLKTDSAIPFFFMNPVMALCNEGKYIIGFVDVKTPGVYVLQLEINNFDTKDTIAVELEILNDNTKP